MLTKKEIYFKAYKELEKRRLERVISQEKNFKIAVKICPEIEILQNQIGLTSMKLLKLIYDRNCNFAEIIEKIKNNNILAQKEIVALLIKNNLPRDFLTPKPFCEKCEDYGIYANERCDCLKKLIKIITSKQLIKNSNLPNMNFENFNLNYYSKKIENDEKISAFKHMSAVLNECKKFCNNFNRSSGGFLMHGLTGLGKTHLSLAIAFEIIDNGFTALYETTSQITRKIFNDKYLNKTENYSYFNILTETDLLIIDDLGGEFQSQLNKSAIFEIINLRTSFNRPIIITTNLKPEELEKVYGTRVMSRIISNLVILSFAGKDNRQKVNLKQQYNR